MADDRPAGAMEHGKGGTAGAQAIELHNAGFAYPGSDRPVILGMNYRFVSGKVYVLRGRNGSGKSTLLKLLAGLYAPTTGRIERTGRSPEVDVVRSGPGAMSGLLQDYNRYYVSFRDNIELGRRLQGDANATEELLMELGLAQVLMDVPARLAARLGRMYEEGIELSGGQWKKVALARALCQSDAGVLLLDEPFNELDAEARAAVIRRITSGRAGRITVIATHDAAILDVADVSLEIVDRKLLRVLRTRDGQADAIGRGCVARGLA